MEKPSMFKSTLILTLISLIAAALLAFSYVGTASKIAEQNNLALQESLKQVISQADKFEEKDGYYLALKENTSIGVAAIDGSPGYGSFVKVLVGMDLDKKVTAIRIIEQSETPGLGANSIKPEFYNQFSGLSIDEIALKKNNGQIDALTGATITSGAVIRGVRLAIENKLSKAIDDINNVNPSNNQNNENNQQSSSSSSTSTTPSTTTQKTKVTDTKLLLSLKQLIPSADDFEIEGNHYLALKSKTTIAVASIASSDGYESIVKVLVAIDLNKKILGIRVIEQQETPGRGARSVEPVFYNQFNGLTLSDVALKADGGKIDAITGATITTSAVIDSVKKAVNDELSASVDKINNPVSNPTDTQNNNQQTTNQNTNNVNSNLGICDTTLNSTQSCDTSQSSTTTSQSLPVN